MVSLIRGALSDRQAPEHLKTGRMDDILFLTPFLLSGNNDTIRLSALEKTGRLASASCAWENIRPKAWWQSLGGGGGGLLSAV